MGRMVSQFRSLVRKVLGADSLGAPELSAGGSPEMLLDDGFRTCGLGELLNSTSFLPGY